ncbi:hypothetical protein KIW84_077120 [Lathyrus oleraceus]|uniref:Uncharacterized protein n=1 Tax=Pisum sativum TaxID=3888 RepID=A0A9D4W102_PEA|nr:hypothetical protein KIW84_077120 [Pisum sativum]
MYNALSDVILVVLKLWEIEFLSSVENAKNSFPSSKKRRLNGSSAETLLFTMRTTLIILLRKLSREAMMRNGFEDTS